MAIRPPLQARSQASWLRVLEAGVAIIEEAGFEALTIARLCDRAAVTAPTIYSRAPDKRTLELAIYEHALTRLDRSSWLRQASTLREAIHALADRFLGNDCLVRALILRSAVEPEIRRRGSESVTELGRQFRAAAGGDERAADACFRVVVAALARRVVHGPNFESEIPLSNGDFVTMLCDMTVPYWQARM